MNPRWSGAALVLALVLLSHAAIFIRMAEAHALAILFWRLLMAWPIMALIVFNEVRSSTKSNSEAPISKLPPTHAHPHGPPRAPLLNLADRFAIWSAGVLLFIHFVSFFVAVQRTSVAASNILFTLNPVTTAAGAWLLHRHGLQLRLAASMALGILGVLALFGPWLWSESSAFDLWGGLMGVLSAVSFSAYLLTSRQVRRRLSNPRFTLELWSVALILAGVSMLLFNVPFFGYSEKTWWAFLALAWLPTLLGHAIFTWCLNHFDINALSCATLSEPIIAAAVAYWLFGENLSFAEVLAFLLTSASIALLTWPWLRGQWHRRLGAIRSRSEAQH